MKQLSSEVEIDVIVEVGGVKYRRCTEVLYSFKDGLLYETKEEPVKWLTLNISTATNSFTNWLYLDEELSSKLESDYLDLIK